jgi:hypothetical protein
MDVHHLLRPGRSTTARLRLPLMLAFLLTPTVGAAPAMATHLQGGYFTAKVVNGASIQGTVTYLETIACTLGAQKAIPFKITAPGAQVYNASVQGTATR